MYICINLQVSRLCVQRVDPTNYLVPRARMIDAKFDRGANPKDLQEGARTYFPSLWIGGDSVFNA